jgi:hypothetical protein
MYLARFSHILISSQDIFPILLAQLLIKDSLDPIEAQLLPLNQLHYQSIYVVKRYKLSDSQKPQSIYLAAIVQEQTLSIQRRNYYLSQLETQFLYQNLRVSPLHYI